MFVSKTIWANLINSIHNEIIVCICTFLFFRYPLELHIVHTNAAHGDDTDAAVDPEECFKNGAYCGLAVVGILFHIGSENNTVLDVSHISLKNFILLNYNFP